MRRNAEYAVRGPLCVLWRPVHFDDVNFWARGCADTEYGSEPAENYATLYLKI